jgi:hypothetical protein
MTINKAQGQTFDSIGLYGGVSGLRMDSFTLRVFRVRTPS